MLEIDVQRALGEHPKIEEPAGILAFRLGIATDERSALWIFSLNPDASLAPNVEEMLKRIDRREGYCIYQQVYSKVDTEWSRANMSAGTHSLGSISDIFTLANIEDAHSLYQLNLRGLKYNLTNFEDHTFEYLVVAQALTDRVANALSWKLSSKAIIIN